MLDYVQQYPECCLAIGVLPAAAMYLRGLRQSSIEDVTVTALDPDARAAIAAEHCTALRIGTVRTADCGADLRAIDCPDLDLRDPALRVLTPDPESEAAYARTRAESAAVETRLAGIAALYDSVRGSEPYAVFKAPDGFTGEIRKGDVLLLPFTTVPVSVALGGTEIETLDYPLPYRTLTKLALVLPKDGTELRIAADRPGQAFLYRPAI